MGATALRRRRHHHQNHGRIRALIPAISAVSCALLFLFAFLSLLAPSPTDQEHLRPLLRRHVFSNGVEKAGVSVFRVPTSGGRLDRDLWKSRLSKFYYGCSNASKKFPEAKAMRHPNRYLLIATSGGLNQQRTGITDAVVAARILNASLVIPKLDQKSFWRDASNFSDIFDVDWFISSLSKDVKIIKELPRRAGKIWTPYTMRVPRKCSERCYQIRVLPNLLKKHAVQLTKFDYRLANKLDMDLQKLRCRVNYHALRFTDPIIEMGEKLVHRMRMRSQHYIALHLRFERDMLAFSGCYYGGGDKERKELGAIRKRWKTLHNSNPDRMRRQGRCPLTPEEVGLMLRALGYGKDVHIYVASGEVYGGEQTLAPLKALFPNFYSKDTLASKEELATFSAFSSRMAALDFIACDESDVFVTNNNGNMAKILAGRRCSGFSLLLLLLLLLLLSLSLSLVFCGHIGDDNSVCYVQFLFPGCRRYYGHKPTIRPNAKKLNRLFLNRGNMTWEVFASSVRAYQRGFMGEPKEVRPGRGEFHENPAACICEDSVAKEKMESDSKRLGKVNGATRKDVGEVVDDQNDDDEEPEWADVDDEDDQSGHLGKGPFNRTNLDYDALTTEEPELEEFISD